MKYENEKAFNKDLVLHLIVINIFKTNIPMKSTQSSKRESPVKGKTLSMKIQNVYERVSSVSFCYVLTTHIA